MIEQKFKVSLYILFTHRYCVNPNQYLATMDKESATGARNFKTYHGAFNHPTIRYQIYDNKLILITNYNNDNNHGNIKFLH
jgi:hypothetical protein